MRRWSEGEREMERLLATGHLQRVPPHREHAVALLAQAQQSLTVPQMAIDAGALAAQAQVGRGTRRGALTTSLPWPPGCSTPCPFGPERPRAAKTLPGAARQPSASSPNRSSADGYCGT